MNHKLFFYLAIIYFHFSGLVHAQSKDVNRYAFALLEKADKSSERNGVKALSYINEVLHHEGKLVDSVKVKLYLSAGNVYSNQESYYQALKYYNKLFELEHEKESLEKLQAYNGVGYVYWRLEDRKKAKEFWLKALEGLKNLKAKKRNIESYIVYNNLAVYERSEKNYIKALEMLKEYVIHTKELKDTAGLVKAYQNISFNNMDLKEFDTAFLYLHKAKNLAKKSNLLSDLGSIYYNLGSFYFSEKINKDSAKFYSLKAFQLGDNHQFPLIKKVSSEILINLYEDENNFEQANRYLHIAKELGEKMTSDENLKKINQQEAEHLLKMSEQDSILKQKKKEILYVASCIVMILFCVCILLFFNLQRNKLKRRTAENDLLVKQLEDKNKELTENAIQMLQANEILDSTHKELSGLKGVANIATKKMLSKIIVDIKSGAKGFNKEEFEKLFRETHEDFYKKLLQKFPTLTRNEIRLCAFAKMNLSIKEISAITQQSPNSIVAARYRLRKKIGLDENQSLTSYMLQF